MLSIILSERDEEKVVDYTEELIYNDTAKMDVEVIRASSWREGFEMSEGEFLCYVEPDCVFTENFFMVSLNILAVNAHYRKLAMVSPILCANYWDKEIHGYTFEMGEVVPKHPEDTSKSYLPKLKKSPQQIQIGYFPGSIIRRSAAERLHYNADTPLKSSAENSLMLWEEGNRILMNPHAKYVSSNDYIDEPLEFGLVSEEVLDIFGRESI